MDRSAQTILVTGATGKQGGSVARHLLRDGFHVRALVRDPESVPAGVLRDCGAQLMVGDFDDADSLDAAIAGAYGVFSVQGWLPDGVDAETRRGIAVAEAAARAKVEHFTYSSVGGADLGTGIPHFESKWRIEQRIHDLELPATIWRPVYFMENLLWQRDAIMRGHIAPPLDPDVPLQFVAVEDIGEFASCGFRNPGTWLGRVTEIAGDQLAYTEIAEILGRVLGEAIVVDQLVLPTEPERVRMMEWFNVAGYHADIARLRRTLPSLRDFETWAREAFARPTPWAAGV
jgi:uncharacterized protein YbjT (DUF2867 family)